MNFITVFTPSYNRRHTLQRVFESLKQQTYRNFEWIVIDDGSNDDTKSLIENFKNENSFFEIRYYYQKNQGKHIATNNAVNYAKGDFFITLDSDDGCKPEAFEELLRIWLSIPEEQRISYKGVACRCCDSKKYKLIGNEFIAGENGFLDSDDIEIRLKYKIHGELWGMTKTEVLKENPYPIVDGLKFFPENVYWGNIGLKYKTRYSNIPLRLYYYNENDNVTKNYNPRELFNVRVWAIQTVMKEKGFLYSPKYFIKQFIGLVRDGLSSKKSIYELYKITNSLSKRIILTLAFPIGYVLYLKVLLGEQK